MIAPAIGSHDIAPVAKPLAPHLLLACWRLKSDHQSILLHDHQPVTPVLLAIGNNQVVVLLALFSPAGGCEAGRVNLCPQCMPHHACNSLFPLYMTVIAINSGPVTSSLGFSHWVMQCCCSFCLDLLFGMSGRREGG
jgi:hypothetical protein